MEEIKLLSLVVPAFEQEKTIIKDIQRIIKTLEKLEIPFEILVVEDGSADSTYKNIKTIKHKNLKIIKNTKNFGKGYSVRHGMLAAKGDIIGFLDAGMEIDPASIEMLLQHMKWYGADIIVGSKLHPVSQVQYPIGRRILSRGYRVLTKTLFGFKIKDSQVGLKIFKRNVVKKVFPKLLVKKFAFDVEILAVAYKLGYTRIYESPVKLDFGASSISSKNFWEVIMRMMWDTFAVYYRVKIIDFYRKSQKK